MLADTIALRPQIVRDDVEIHFVEQPIADFVDELGGSGQQLEDTDCEFNFLVLTERIEDVGDFNLSLHGEFVRQCHLNCKRLRVRHRARSLRASR